MSMEATVAEFKPCFDPKLTEEPRGEGENWEQLTKNPETEKKFSDEQINLWREQLKIMFPKFSEGDGEGMCFINNVLEIYQTSPHLVDNLVEQHKQGMHREATKDKREMIPDAIIIYDHGEDPDEVYRLAKAKKEAEEAEASSGGAEQEAEEAPEEPGTDEDTSSSDEEVKKSNSNCLFSF